MGKTHSKRAAGYFAGGCNEVLLPPLGQRMYYESLQGTIRMDLWSSVMRTLSQNVEKW